MATKHTTHLPMVPEIGACTRFHANGTAQTLSIL